MNLRCWSSVAFAALVAACGGSDSKPATTPATTQTYVSAVTSSTGTQGVYRTASAPTAGAGPTATATNSSAIIPGGTALFTITGSGAFTTIIITIPGVAGYWELTVPSGTTQTVGITFGQAAPRTFTMNVGVGSGSTVGTYRPVPVTLTTVGTGQLQVSLTWDTATDVDLHVIEPNGTEIYYGAPTSSSGGSLDMDSNSACALDMKNNENVTYGSRTPPAGNYIVRVDYWDGNCGTQPPVTNYVVTVNKRGVVTTYRGTLTGAGDFGGPGSGVTVTNFTF